MDIFNRKKVKRLQEIIAANRYDLDRAEACRISQTETIDLLRKKIAFLESNPPKRLSLQCSPHQKRQPDKTLVDFAIELKMRGRKKPFCEVGGMRYYYLVAASTIDQIINSKK